MTEVRSPTGVQFKLASPKGTILGTITIPCHVAEMFEKEYQVPVYMPPKWLASYQEWRNDTPIETNMMVLTRSYAVPGALELWGTSIEEFEKLDGYSFSPSAAYLRSIVE